MINGEAPFAGPGMTTQVPIVRVTDLKRVHFSFEKTEDGGMLLNLDVVWGPHGAERYTVPFNSAEWENFRDSVDTAGSRIEIPKPRIVS